MVEPWIMALGAVVVGLLSGVVGAALIRRALIKGRENKPEIVDAADARTLGQLDGHVTFEGVRFTYGRGDEVLHGIDLDVPAGTTVALVGHTGAGKSTIAKLLARFYDPTHGRITLDGTDLRQVTQASLRCQTRPVVLTRR